ncbi:MAG: hypothetical protein LBB80_03995 [Treponema sp.]|nr:hypothetical protein [Treponema sp.]
MGLFLGIIAMGAIIGFALVEWDTSTTRQQQREPIHDVSSPKRNSPGITLM